MVSHPDPLAVLLLELAGMDRALDRLLGDEGIPPMITAHQHARLHQYRRDIRRAAARIEAHHDRGQRDAAGDRAALPQRLLGALARRTCR